MGTGHPKSPRHGLASLCLRVSPNPMGWGKQVALFYKAAIEAHRGTLPVRCLGQEQSLFHVCTVLSMLGLLHATKTQIPNTPDQYVTYLGLHNKIVTKPGTQPIPQTTSPVQFSRDKTQPCGTQLDSYLGIYLAVSLLPRSQSHHIVITLLVFNPQHKRHRQDNLN